jgi:endonuclease/exonuclease/phosphatase family metal-dependent hydrolase
VRGSVSGGAALILTALAFPFLLARMAGGRAPSPGPELASLAPVAVLPAVAAVAVAAGSSWWLAVALAIPAVVLAGVQLPPRRAAHPARPVGAPAPSTVRLLSVNVLGGSASPAAVVRLVREHDVDVLAVQELTPALVRRLDAAGLPGLLPFSHLDPRPGARGTGLWARAPLTPLPPVPGMGAAAPRARVSLPGRPPLTVAAVHPKAPLNHHQRQWQRELAAIRDAVTATGGPQIVAGDFNASRDHRAFREILAAGLADCGDTAADRPWPGFTWPSIWPGFLVKAHPPFLPFMRLDHILISRDSCRAWEVQVLRVPRTDHCAVFAVIGVSPEPCAPGPGGPGTA